MNTKDPRQIAIQFNDCITQQDIEGLANLMTGDHTFIDQDGNVQGPKEVMVQNWKKFFSLCPNYKNTFTRIEVKDYIVVMHGYANWSEEQPHDPVIWTAKIVNDLVAEWHLYYDTPENRVAFNIG